MRLRKRLPCPVAYHEFPDADHEMVHVHTLYSQQVAEVIVEHIEANLKIEGSS